MQRSGGGKSKRMALKQPNRAGFSDVIVDERLGLSSTSARSNLSCASADGESPRLAAARIDTSEGSVHRTGRFPSTSRLRRPERAHQIRIEIGTEARCALALPPLAPGQMMELHVDTDELVKRLVEELRQREERLLEELVDRVVERLDRSRGSRAVPTAGESVEIMGVEPHALYPVSFVADRWNVSADNVRKKSQEELPRAGWKGGEIRYRGFAILRYEGVEFEERSEIEDRSDDDVLSEARPSVSPHDHLRPAAPKNENQDGRPYNCDLPDLSDEDGSPD